MLEHLQVLLNFLVKEGVIDCENLFFLVIVEATVFFAPILVTIVLETKVELNLIFICRSVSKDAPGLFWAPRNKL